jgi:hypothetical protein
LNFALQKENIDIENIVGEDSLETLIEGSIELSRQQEPISRVISLGLIPRITSKEVVEGAVQIRGALDVDMLYEVEDEGEEIHVAHYWQKQAIPFAYVAEVAGVIPPGLALVTVTLEEIEYEVISARLMEVDVVVSFDIKVMTKNSVNVVSGILTQKPDDFSLSRETYLVEKVVGQKTLQSTVNSIIEVPRDNPSIDSILKPLAEGIVTDADIIDGKVRVRGIIESGIIYTATSRSGVLSYHLVRRGAQVFEHMLALPGIYEGMNAIAGVEIADIQANLISEREVDLDVLININAKVHELKELNVVTDIASKLDVQIELLKTALIIEKFTGRANIEIPVKGIVGAGDEDPPIGKILDIRLIPYVNDSRLLENRAVVDGDVGIEVIYVGMFEGKDEEVLHSFMSQIPFDGAVDIEDAGSGMSVVSCANIKDANYDMVDERGVDIVITLNVDVEVVQKEEMEAIIDAVTVEPVRRTPGITICNVLEEDTLWRISRRYGTDEETILKLNGLSSENDIPVGSKLIIPRKVG